jgi:hypothetical protein
MASEKAISGYRVVERSSIHVVWEHTCGHRLTMKPDRTPANAGLCEACDDF